MEYSQIPWCIIIFPIQMAHILGSIPHEITSHMPGPSKAPAELFWGGVVHECQSVSSGLIPRRRGQVMTSDDKFSWMYPAW